MSMVWKPGKEVAIADMLSRSSPKRTTGPMEIDEVNMVSYLPIRPERLERLKTATESDPTMQVLKDTIIQGWPHEKSACKVEVTPYFSIRDELSVQDGLIFKGERLVIPRSMRTEMKTAVHSSHLGLEACLRRAREAIYWPGMNAEMKEYMAACETCRTFEVRQCREPLIPHDVPSRPWEKVAIDLFTLNTKDYMVTVDYYSDFWEIDELQKTDTGTIIKRLKAHFARHGIPSTIYSDNARNLVSAEFMQFSIEWDFEHITSSPYHSQSNGKAESAVKAAKRMLKKAIKSKSDPYHGWQSDDAPEQQKSQNGTAHVWQPIETKNRQ